jgi:hypothetical protein
VQQATVDITSEAFGARLAAILRAARRDQERSMRAMAWWSRGSFRTRTLKELEAGRADLRSVDLAALASLYRIDLAALLEERVPLVVDVSAGTISTAGVARSFDPEHQDGLLLAYLHLVRDLRDLQQAQSIALRREDVEALAGGLRADAAAVLDRLGELMGSTVTQRRSAVAMFAAGAALIVLSTGAIALEPGLYQPVDDGEQSGEAAVVTLAAADDLEAGGAIDDAVGTRGSGGAGDAGASGDLARRDVGGDLGGGGAAGAGDDLPGAPESSGASVPATGGSAPGSGPADPASGSTPASPVAETPPAATPGGPSATPGAPTDAGDGGASGDAPITGGPVAASPVDGPSTDDLLGESEPEGNGPGENTQPGDSVGDDGPSANESPDDGPPAPGPVDLETPGPGPADPETPAPGPANPETPAGERPVDGPPGGPPVFDAPDGETPGNSQGAGNTTKVGTPGNSGNPNAGPKTTEASATESAAETPPGVTKTRPGSGAPVRGTHGQGRR